MAYFLRFTDTAKKDTKRATSIHASQLEVSEYTKKEAAEMFDCETSEIKKFEGCWCQVLNGLCGYELTAETLEEAIDEVENGVYQFSFVGKAVIFSGSTASQHDLVPDGDLFIPIKIEIEL